MDSEKGYVALTFYTIDQNESEGGYAHHQYVLFSDDGGVSWGDPYMVNNYSDNGDIDISEGVVYLTYLEYQPWINTGSFSPSPMAAPPNPGNPAFYITIKLIWQGGGTVVEKELKYDDRAVYGIPRVSVNGSRIDVAVADLNSPNIYYWTSADMGSTWTNGELVTNYSGDVRDTGFDIVSAYEKTYIFWFRNTSATGLNLMDRELFMKIRTNGKWGNDIILTTAYYDSQDVSAVVDTEGNLEVMWSDNSGGAFLTPHTVQIDSAGYLKGLNRSLVDYGPGIHPSVAVSPKSVPGHPDMHYNFMVWQSFENGKWVVRYRDNVMNISVLSSTTTMASLVSSAEAYVQEMPDDHFSNSYLRTPLTKQYEVLGRLVSKIQDIDNKTEQTDNPIRKRALAASRSALLQAMSVHLTYNIIPKMDGSSGGNPNNDWVVSYDDQENLNSINNALLSATVGISITSCSHSQTPTTATISFTVDWGDSTSNFYASAYMNGELKYSNRKQNSYSFTFYGLTPETYYSCHLSASAYLSDNTHAIANKDCSVTTRSATPQILDVRYSDKSYTVGDFSWSVIWPASGSQVTSAEIYDDSSGALQWSGTPSKSADGKYHLDLAGVKRGKTYSYTITATYNNDYTTTKTGSFTVPLPDISDVKAVDISDSSATITWKVDHYFSDHTEEVSFTVDGKSITPVFDEVSGIWMYSYSNTNTPAVRLHSYAISVVDDTTNGGETVNGMFYLSSPTADIVKTDAENLAQITWTAGTGNYLKGNLEIYWRESGGSWKHDTIAENPATNEHSYSIGGLSDGTCEYYLASDTSDGYVQTAVNTFEMSQY
ncbi:MAG: hypothetical protein J7M38_08985, partial [Armatimonadetes bacterium]|nr:hypothetical protein [Armatimonadota bacterium]